MSVETADEEKAAREAKAIRRVVDTLVESFTETHSAVEIEQTIDTARRRFDGDPIRDFIPILVERIVRRELAPISLAKSTVETPSAPVESEPRDPLAVLRRIPFGDKRVLAGIGAAVVALVAVVVLATRQSTPAPAPVIAVTPPLTAVHGVVGSEKMPFFEDPKVAKALADKGFKVDVEPAGSRQIATSIDLGKYDFAFPSSETAAERIQRQRNITAKYTPFSSPMAIATFRPIADLLTKQGVVRPGPVTTFDVAEYLRLVRSETQWSQLPDNAAYPVRKNILISTTDPRTSNSAAMYLAIASYIANDDTIVQGQNAEQAVLPTVAKLFVGQGHTGNSTEGPFEQYLRDGMGPTPMVWIYEAQYVDAAVNGRLGPDAVLMYPSPTVLSRHTLIPLDQAGDKLGRLLTTDPELRRLAAEHGFRTGDADRFAKVTTDRQVPVPAELIDVVETPTYDTMEHLLDGVTKSYN
ncbi:three-helix bundle dimerization domain-containing protein [Nocardia arthritidis]|uniref:Extracellular solute-binding protein n=1 Tax=Nocardia arthritidis TaxID=228602 RepID=A0A6G9YPT6_9NOCA|nr:hypothetical protein [Nocardia arthritidis]QIS15097.1 hypothetical protein F5544_36340 [Nocardia arthritidis]